MKQKHWTYNGIKRYKPDLSWEQWEKIMARGDHYNKNHVDVLNRVRD
jgi:hypothetical protein